MDDIGADGTGGTGGSVVGIATFSGAAAPGGGETAAGSGAAEGSANKKI